MKIGDVVTCRKPVEAYYSSYGIKPRILFRPRQVGIVSAVGVPSVWRDGVMFTCVDFFAPETGQTERCALLSDNIARVGT